MNEITQCPRLCGKCLPHTTVSQKASAVSSFLMAAGLLMSGILLFKGIKVNMIIGVLVRTVTSHLFEIYKKQHCYAAYPLFSKVKSVLLQMLDALLVQCPQAIINPNQTQKAKHTIPRNLLLVVVRGEEAHTQQVLEKTNQHKRQAKTIVKLINNNCFSDSVKVKN